MQTKTKAMAKANVKLLAGTVLLGLASPIHAAAPLRPDQAAFRALYQEMVETDTSVTTGSCTALADKIEARLRMAGFDGPEIFRYAPPDRPQDGLIVAILPGTSTRLKPILLLGHLDLVVAKREDWSRDPYKLIEENGYFYGRGTQDMKAMDAIWVDMLSRFRTSGYRPKRTLKLALTCGEETAEAFNGAQWLAENRRDLIDAEFALNEGGGGRSDGKGRIEQARLHVGEKASVNFRIEAVNPGGHSSAPIKDNAIYELADALVKLRDHEFPVMLSDTTRAFFAKAGAVTRGAMGQAMVAIATNPADTAAEALVKSDKSYNSMLRTTCVATTVAAGHANNALPQRAAANINCRIFPGIPIEAVQAKLEEVVNDPRLKITLFSDRGGASKPPPLNPKLIGPAEQLVARYFPGVPLIPFMSTGATDGIYLAAVGIPSYGPPGLYGDPDGNGTHGLNERALVAAVYTGRDLLTDLVKLYASKWSRPSLA